jgi:hypothetical protein
LKETFSIHGALNRPELHASFVRLTGQPETGIHADAITRIHVTRSPLRE